jgi:hypothetical protein
MEGRMRSTKLQLTLAGRRFSITPLPAHLESTCTADQGCTRPASHRLLSRALGGVRLLCDAHTFEFARDQGHKITSVRVDDPAA